MTELLRVIFNQKELQPVGFSFHHDIEKLKNLCADVNLEQGNVVDIQHVMMERIEQKDLISLKTACEVLLGYTLDKSEQMSDWVRIDTTTRIDIMSWSRNVDH